MWKRAVERKRAVVTKRAGELWQGGKDKRCDMKERRSEGEM